MESAIREPTGWSARRIVQVGMVTGLVSGTMMAGVEMVYGWISDAHTFWDAPMAIWAWVAGLEHFGQPGNHVWPIVLGMGGHMMNSAVAGVLFVAVMAGLRLRGAAIMAGTAYGLGLWAVLRYGILPLRHSTEVLFTRSTVSPQWVWSVAHAALGMTAGAVYAAAAARVAAVPAFLTRRPRGLSHAA